MLGLILRASSARSGPVRRPTEQPQALFDRLTKTEKLKEDFRDKSYVAISDKARTPYGRLPCLVIRHTHPLFAAGPCRMAPNCGCK